MADITWPNSTGRAWGLVRYTETARWNVELTKSRNGKVYTSYLPGMRYAVTLTVPEDSIEGLADRGLLMALLQKLRGGSNRLLIWNLMRPAPLGTMRGSPVVSASAAANAYQVSVSGSGTLLPGDRIGFGAGGQRVEVVEPVTLGGPVTFEPPLRAPVTAGTAVVWDRPLLRLVLTTPDLPDAYEKTRLPGFALDFVEE